MEGSGLGFNIYPDEFYKSWPFPVSGEEIKKYNLLSPISNKELLGDLLADRAACLTSAKRFDEAAACWKLVKKYLPEDSTLNTIVQDSEDRADIQHKIDTWNSLWDGLANQPEPHGPKALYFNDWKVQIQIMMNTSTNLTAIEKSVNDYKASFKQYCISISDNPFIGTPLPNEVFHNLSPFRGIDSLPIIYIPYGEVPMDYARSGIPQALQKRIEKLNKPDEIIEEMKNYMVEDVELNNLDMQQQKLSQSTAQSPQFDQINQYDQDQLRLQKHSINSRRKALDRETARYPKQIMIVKTNTSPPTITPLKINIPPLTNPFPEPTIPQIGTEDE